MGRGAVHFRERLLWRVGGDLQLVPSGDRSAGSERDAVSSRGWGIGYIGGGVLLALNLLLFLNAKKVGITEGMAVRISLELVGSLVGGVHDSDAAYVAQSRAGACAAAGKTRGRSGAAGNCGTRWRISGAIRRA